MKVKRIVANLAAPDLAAAEGFYKGILGLDLLMDLGFIQTFGSKTTPMDLQVSVATEGGNGTAVPSLSIEVDDVHEALSRMRDAGVAIEYGPIDEPWGVRRFFVRDPFGHLLNVLGHR